MELIFLSLVAYTVAGCLYGAVAVSRFKNNIHWAEDESSIKAGMYLIFLASIGFWPLYLYRDITDA